MYVHFSKAKYGIIYLFPRIFDGINAGTIWQHALSFWLDIHTGASWRIRMFQQFSDSIWTIYDAAQSTCLVFLLEIEITSLFHLEKASGQQTALWLLRLPTDPFSVLWKYTHLQARVENNALCSLVFHGHSCQSSRCHLHAFLLSAGVVVLFT